MSLALLEREASHPEFEIVSVDTVEELLLLNKALTTVIAEQRLSDNTDEHTLELAEALRESVGKDVVEVLSGERPSSFTYPIKEGKFVLQAVEVVKKKEQAEQQAQKVYYPEFNWLRDPKKTHPAAQNARQNFYDL